jgi:hypothetical protein
VSAFELSLRVVFNPTDEKLNKCFEDGKTVALKTKAEKQKKTLADWLSLFSDILMYCVRTIHSDCCKRCCLKYIGLV